MKKLLFVFVFALAGITSTYANSATKWSFQTKDVYINNIKAENLLLEILSSAFAIGAGKCTFAVTIITKTIKTTFYSTANTCKEASEAVNKVVSVFLLP